jgi:hypothetical protein
MSVFRNRSLRRFEECVSFVRAGQAMSATGTSKIRRKSRPPTSFAGKHLVFGELKERGFDAQLGPREHEMLVRAGDSPPMRIQVKTTHSTPWYVRHTSFVGSLANEVTVFVLLGLEGNAKSARFFVAKNRDLAAHFRVASNCEGIGEPPNIRSYGYIDYKFVEKYENNLDILR